MLAEHVGKLSKMQERLFAEQAQALLVIFQGLDASGSVCRISHLLTGVNPEGVTVQAFKQPNKLSSRMTFSGAPPSSRQSAASSACSTAPITKPSRSRACIRSCCTAKDTAASLETSTPFSKSGSFRSRTTYGLAILRHAKIVRLLPAHFARRATQAPARALGRSGKSVEGVAVRRHGAQYFKDYWRAFETAFAATSTKDAPGTSSPPTTSSMRACSFPRSWSKRWSRSIFLRHSRWTRSAGGSLRRLEKR